MQARPEGGDGLIGRLRCTVPDRPTRAPWHASTAPCSGERPPARPNRSRPQQFHLDAGVPGLARARQRLLGPGAVRLDDGDPARGRHVRADPAGHPFRLVRD
ncbi:VOC family protein [Streptomyces lavendulocolor]